MKRASSSQPARFTIDTSSEALGLEDSGQKVADEEKSDDDPDDIVHGRKLSQAPA
jgi:hypothetical protein